MNLIATIDGVLVEEGSGNVFADLGLVDASEMLIKSELAFEMQQFISARNLTQQGASELFGVSRERLSDILRGKFRDISQQELTEYLNRARVIAA